MIGSTNPRIMANNIRELEKAGSGGTTVVGNPEGSATQDLSKIGIGNTIYAIPGSGYTPNYSTTEALVGASIGESPIYGRLIPITASKVQTSWSNANNEIDLSDVDMITRADLICYFDAQNSMSMYMPLNVYITDISHNLQFRTFVDTNLAGETKYVYLEYTKNASNNSKKQLRKK